MGFKRQKWLLHGQLIIPSVGPKVTMMSDPIKLFWRQYCNQTRIDKMLHSSVTSISSESSLVTLTMCKDTSEVPNKV